MNSIVARLSHLLTAHWFIAILISVYAVQFILLRSDIEQLSRTKDTSPSDVVDGKCSSRWHFGTWPPQILTRTK